MEWIGLQWFITSIPPIFNFDKIEWLWRNAYSVQFPHMHSSQKYENTHLFKEMEVKYQFYSYFKKKKNVKGIIVKLYICFIFILFYKLLNTLEKIHYTSFNSLLLKTHYSVRVGKMTSSRRLVSFIGKIRHYEYHAYKK